LDAFDADCPACHTTFHSVMPPVIMLRLLTAHSVVFATIQTLYCQLYLQPPARPPSFSFI
jgi:hypothetical protein